MSLFPFSKDLPTQENVKWKKYNKVTRADDIQTSGIIAKRPFNPCLTLFVRSQNHNAHSFNYNLIVANSIVRWALEVEIMTSHFTILANPTIRVEIIRDRDPPRFISYLFIFIVKTTHDIRAYVGSHFYSFAWVTLIHFCSATLHSYAPRHTPILCHFVCVSEHARIYVATYINHITLCIVTSFFYLIFFFVDFFWLFFS